MLYKQKVKGPKQLSKENLTKQLVESSNRSLFFLPISLYNSIYYAGLKRYDPEKLEARRELIIEEYDQEIASLDSGSSKQNRLIGKKDKKVGKIDKSLVEGNLFMRWGEPIAILDSANIDLSKVNLERYVHSKGWFRAKVNYDVKIKQRKAFVDYAVNQGPRYRLDSIFVDIPDTAMKSLLRSKRPNRKIVKGQPYDSELLSEERQRIDNVLKNNGYYNFTRQYVRFEVDTTWGEHQVAIKLSILLPQGQQKHKIFQLDSVIFTTDASVQEFGRNRQSKLYKGIKYQYFDRKYSEKVLNRRVYIRPGQIYSRENTLNTQRELARMDNFKFVNINYDTTGGQFVANIFVSPLERYQWSNEAGLSITQGYPGPFLSMTLKRRNIFGRLGTFDIDARIGVDGVAAASNPDKILASTEAGGNVGITLPQFFLPISEETKKKLGFYDPKTNVKAGITFTTRPEYTRFEVRGSNTYSWTTLKNNRFDFSLVDIGLIRTPRMDSVYLARLEELQQNGNNLILSFRPSVVSNMRLTSTRLSENYGISLLGSSYFSYSIEPGGTLTNLVGKDFFGKRNLETYSYVKFDIDYRKMSPIDRNRGWAYKVRGGIAIPYGANGLLPYEKYFFAGGSISNRAWKPRRLGPGSFDHINENGQVSYQFEQNGEIIIETSLEYRQRIFRFIQGALFVDAGNIWTISEDNARPGAKFEFNRFYKEIAIGAGAGLRLDFSYLLVRLDAGLKVVDPARPEGKRFILDLGFNDPPFDDRVRTEPWIWTIAIGYPF